MFSELFETSNKYITNFVSRIWPGSSHCRVGYVGK